jgi:2-C-methyl-D-erythritol 2,4-cyclodiphosphate synthase
MRIGHGFDAHRFTPGRPLVLGGVTVPHDQGLEAHSDGDVVIHALCDALLDDDPAFAGIDSRLLLRRVREQLVAARLEVVSVDLTVVAQQPRLAAHVDAMRSRLAADLGMPAARLNLKATTTERMGFTGRGEGIAAFAVVLLEE